MRLVLPSPELTALRERLAAEAVAEHAPPGVPAGGASWTPHVTLAGRLRPAQLEAARRLFAEPGERPATATRLRHWDAVAKRATTLSPAG